MDSQNEQKNLDVLLSRLREEGRIPTLFLHACCAPCSSYVLEYLSKYFRITVFFYNPNIYPSEENRIRADELSRLICALPAENPITLMEGKYDPDVFYACTKGMETLPEGGERCFACYRLRLAEAAKIAKEKGFDYFASTLSLSPYKNAKMLNAIGRELAEEYGVSWLPNDFKKRNGHKRSIELSKEYDLYRQDYCGCVYSYLARRGSESGESV